MDLSVDAFDELTLAAFDRSAGLTFRFDSIRFDTIQFDSIGFDAIRCDAI